MTAERHQSATAATRAEHLAWCKARALAYVDAGDLQGAFSSFASDVLKHPDTASLTGVISELGMPLLMGGHLSSAREMRDWIQGFAG